MEQELSLNLLPVCGSYSPNRVALSGLSGIGCGWEDTRHTHTEIKRDGWTQDMTTGLVKNYSVFLSDAYSS